MRNRICSPGCPAEHTLGVIGGRKVLVIFHLLEGTRRFSQLRRLIPGLTQKMLTQQLRQLEHDGIVSRKVYPVVPPRVEYSLTPRGASLKGVIAAMSDWGATDHKRLTRQAAPSARKTSKK